MKKDFVDNFTSILADYGDMFFTSGDTDLDYKTITETIKNQGYWAGGRVRYFFDENFNFEGVQERIFGE